MTDTPSGLPHVFPTVVHMLAEAAARSPSAIGLVCGDRRLSYAQYLRCVAGFAHELIAHGARTGRVALVCRNSLDLPIAMFGVHAAGGQAVPINPAYTARELSYILTDAAPSAIIYDAEVAATVEPLIASLAIPHAVYLGASHRTLDWWKDDAILALPQPLPQPDDLATLQYTGGTTGRPKGVNISHRQMAVNISQREAALPTRADDERILCMMPLFHVFAVAMCLHLAAYCRGRLVIMPRYDAQDVLDLIVRERISRLPAGPTVFIGLLSHEKFATTDFSSLRTAYSGSAPLPEETLRCWQECTGSPILEGYGQTEAGPVLTYIRDGGQLKVGSSGPALPLTEIEIVDVATGRETLHAGEVGEIRARGPQIMSGYRNKPQETAETLRDGWLYTGDIGHVDADGYTYIVDRKKEMIKYKGFGVAPAELEALLMEHPAVMDSAVIGVSDEEAGEVPKGFVVVRPGHSVTGEELIAFVNGKLAGYKKLHYVEFIDAIPKVPSGKILRRELKERERALRAGEQM